MKHILLPASLLAALAAPALGQTASPAASPPAEAHIAPVQEHLLGDWGGLRTNLADRGVYFSFDALTEFAGNVSGGVKQGATFASQEAIESDIDWQRLAGLNGFSTHLVVVNRSGSSDSALFGDNLLPVQEIYGSGGNVALHLVSFYGQEQLFGDRLDIAAGRMNVENDFASSPLYCTFLNNALCGDPKALPGGDIGHSAYPDGVWAGRVKIRPTTDTYAEIGVYEVSQGLYGDIWRSGWYFDGGLDSGVYIPVELAYEPGQGAGQLPGHYKIGFGYDSSGTYHDYSEVLPGTPQTAHTGNTQVWLLADQMLLRQGPGNNDGLIGMAGFIANDPENSPYAEQYFIAASDGDFWPARPKDTLGLLFTYNTVSGQLGKVQAEEEELGLPISNSATGIQTHEMIVEANYTLHLYRGLTFEPDFQYVIRPNAQSDIRNAVVFGFRAHVVF